MARTQPKLRSAVGQISKVSLCLYAAVTVGNSGKSATACVHVALLKLQALVQEHKVAIALHFSLPSWWMCPLCRSFASASGYVSLPHKQVFNEVRNFAFTVWHSLVQYQRENMSTAKRQISLMSFSLFSKIILKQMLYFATHKYISQLYTHDAYFVASCIER